MGIRANGNEGNRFRYRAGAGEFAAIVDLHCTPDAEGSMGAGIVHHVAFRTESDAQQHAWGTRIARLDYDVSPMLDHKYFHSIYFREPRGVLFEIATARPGFTADEPAGELGTRLQLPPWMEPIRHEREQVLPPSILPSWWTERSDA